MGWDGHRCLRSSNNGGVHTLDAPNARVGPRSLPGCDVRDATKMEMLPIAALVIAVIAVESNRRFISDYFNRGPLRHHRFDSRLCQLAMAP